MQAPSLHLLPDAVVDLILTFAYRDVWYDTHKGQLRLVCRRWAAQILREAAAGGITFTRPLSVSSMSFLEHKLPDLRGFTCSYKLESLQPLTALTGLSFLSLRLGSFASAAPLGSLCALQRLELLEGNASELDGNESWSELGHLPKLQEIFIQYQGTVDMEWLDVCLHLREVVLTINSASEPPVGLLGIGHLSKLGILFDTPLSEVLLSPLTGLRALMLESIHVGNEIDVDVLPLAHLSDLRFLLIENVTLRNLEALSVLKGLTCLALPCCSPLWHGFEKHGAEWLATLTKLQQLDLEETRMRDDNIAMLSKLVLLQSLNMGENQRVKHVAALAALPNLRWLGICGCDRIRDADLLAPVVDICTEEQDLSSSWFQDA